MSAIKLRSVQYGISTTPANNFVLKTPDIPDQTLRLYRGSLDNVSTQIFSVGSDNALTVSGAVNSGTLTITSSSIPALNIVDSGSGAGAALKLTGNGVTTPSKVIRARSGILEFINDANSTIIASLTDAGVFAASQFNGSGAGLTGTASSLTSGGANAVNGISGWTYTNSGANPAYVWCTDGSSGYQHLTTPAALSVGYATQANSLNGVITTGGGTFTSNLAALGQIRAAAGFHWNPSNGSYALTPDDYTQPGIYRQAAVADCGSIGDVSYVQAYHQPGVTSFWQWNIGGSGNYFRMSNNGVGTSQGGWTTTSDTRVKKNRLVIEGALDKVDALTGYTYDRIDMVEYDTGVPRKAGVIAQDVLNVLPEAVIVPRNYDREAMTGDNLTLHTDALIGLLVNAVKELKAKVDALEARTEGQKT